MAETCFVTGLAVPSGVATSVATVLAIEGRMSPTSVLLAAVAGGALGDSLGFWIGRAGRHRLSARDGWAARVLHRHRRATEPFFGRHPLYSVTLARLVSFVRTLMPMSAGMGPLPYRTFLVYELPGVMAWAATYMLVGLLARESWRVATSVVGVGWTLVFVVIGLILWLRSRRRGARPPEPASGDEPC